MQFEHSKDIPVKKPYAIYDIQTSEIFKTINLMYAHILKPSVSRIVSANLKSHSVSMSRAS